MAVAFSSCAQQKKKIEKSDLKTQADSISYAIGTSIGGSLKKDALDKIVNFDIMKAAMESTSKGDSAMMDPQTCQMVIQQYLNAEKGKKGAENLEIGRKFLEENKKKPGVTTTASGLQYEVIKMGTGPKPTADDKVTTHYTGTTINGKVFDSSVQRGQPAQFGVKQVIPGWTEALQLMPVGSKWKLYIPSNIAYGERGAGQDIGTNETLIFEIELISIDKDKDK
jgi:FKBP-type peptidyl-prolyl cis-trans isomerase